MIKILLVFILVLVFAGAGWFGYQNFTAKDAKQAAVLQTEKPSASPLPSKTASASATPSDGLSDTVYTNKSGFTMKAPKDWVMDESGKLGSLVIFTNPSTDPKEKTATITVVSEKTTANFDDYIKSNKEALPSFLVNYKVTVDKVAKTQSGLDAYLLGGTFGQGEIILQNEQFITENAGTAYVVTATADKSVWSKYQSVMEKSLLSFEPPAQKAK